MRTQLPTRRRNETRQITYRQATWMVTVGFDSAGAPREVFATGPKEGSDMQHVLSDACVVISIALQHGIAPAELSKSLGVIPGFQGEEPASPIGAVLRCVSGSSAPALGIAE